MSSESNQRRGLSSPGVQADMLWDCHAYIMLLTRNE